MYSTFCQLPPYMVFLIMIATNYNGFWHMVSHSLDHINLTKAQLWYWEDYVLEIGLQHKQAGDSQL